MLKETNKLKSICHAELVCHLRCRHGSASNHYGSRNKFGMTNESGRSMIEMLGVLAIIGVLSVGGIAGYTTAMRSYKANEIINATSMLYMMGLAQNAGEGTGTLKYTETIGASLSDLSEITYANKQLTVAITDEAVCNQVLTKLGSKASGSCSTKTKGYYALTVMLGESSEPTYSDEDQGKPCTSGYFCDPNFGNYVYGCMGGTWQPGWRCTTACTDNKRHEVRADACVGGAMEDA